jgi:hypothetical protein
MKRRSVFTNFLVAAVLALPVAASAGQSPAPAAPPTPRAQSPFDLTGQWVSIISEDWRFRMVTPGRGDHPSIPLTPAAMERAAAWDPVADEAAGEQCRSYGAAAIMRVPGRVRFSWTDDFTLKLETDAGQQVRTFHFSDVPVPAEASWQGHSRAQWEIAATGGGMSGIGSMNRRPVVVEGQRFGSLKVVTTGMKPGYLRKNGVPYSANATLTEYFNVHVAPNGERWLVVTSVVNDPENLQLEWITSPNFREEADRAKWSPTPCSATW